MDTDATGQLLLACPPMSQTAKKSLGQHFLKDRNAIRRIVEVVPEGAAVIEIGPGPGAITRPLMARAGRMAVIEMDDRFAGQWREEASLSVYHGDVMQLLDRAVAEFRPEWIAGNLPYNISGPLTARLAGLELTGGMVLMYQREVAERITAGSGSKAYGGLSVLARHHYNVKRLLTLPPGAFSPPPKVHSAVVTLIPHGRKPDCSYDALQRTVRTGFAHRRKTIANNFKGILTEEDWHTLAIDPRSRPEQLDYDAWVRLASVLHKEG